jgi:ABC-type glycerol-3-phosphate transport system permease component
MVRSWRRSGTRCTSSALSVAIATLSGLGIALLLDSTGPGSHWLVAGAVLPWAIPEIVNALMWQWIYNPTYSALNGLLVSLGLTGEYRAWLSTPTSAMHAVVFAYAWKLVPFVVIILYAALRSVPAELYESAQIDGAGDWALLRYVSLPVIAPAAVVAVTFCVVWSMRAFDIVYLQQRHCTRPLAVHEASGAALWAAHPSPLATRAQAGPASPVARASARATSPMRSTARPFGSTARVSTATRSVPPGPVTMPASWLTSPTSPVLFAR